MRIKGWNGSIRKTLTFDRTALVGLAFLVASFFVGALLRNSAYLTNDPRGRFLTACDTYLRGFCIPTAYFSIPMGPLGLLVINITSSLVSATFFVLGVVLVRK
ncbi:MAG: hypothetical protein ACLQEQ_01920 [Nitrososphaerales archaeon]